MNPRGALRPIYLSFYSAAFYREVGSELAGTWFGYLFFIVALGAIPGMVGGYMAITKIFGTELPAIIRQVPTVRVSGGVASIDPPGPHVVLNPVDNSPLVILDTSGTTTSFDNTTASVLLLKDRMLVRRDGRDAGILKMKDLEDTVIDENLLEGWRNTMWNWMSVIYFPVVVLISFLFRVVQVLLFAVVGMLYARRVDAPIDYAGAIRLTVFAATPAVLVSALRDALGIASNLGTVFDFLLVLVYLHFAVRANGGTRPGGDLSISV